MSAVCVGLLLFSAIALQCVTTASPISSFVSLYDDLDDDNYDIIIDQRQNGTENFRIRVNGLNIALPSDEFENQEEPSQITEAEIASLLGIQTTTKAPASASGGLNDFASFAGLFDFKKKSSSKKTLDDTQSRTKDLPTESQLSGDARKTIRDFVKGEGRRYKLLVGEKYIIPLLQFLKKQAAANDDGGEDDGDK